MSQAGQPEEIRHVRSLIVLVCVAVLSRLVSLQWLHPLQWDEVEYFRATDWVRRGLIPYRDFWEHHTPLQWWVFAPVSGINASAGVDAIVTMRWMQVPLWIATFVLISRWMTRSGVPRMARWAGIAIATGSSLFMIPAVEYRIDTLGCALVIFGLVLVQRASDSRGSAFAGGVALAAAGLANIRLGPLLAAIVLLLRFVDLREGRWRNNVRTQWVWAGVASMLAAAALFFVATGSAEAAFQQVWVENYLGDRHGTFTAGAFSHRLLMPFGVRLLGGAPAFDPMGVDPGGVVILLVGAFAMLRSLGRWRAPDALFVLAVLQLVNVLFIAKMKNVYVYHFEIVVLLMVPLVARELSRIANRRVLVAVAGVVVLWSSFAAVFRGKELDRAYQDRVMREVHAFTQPGESVFDGVGWALRREPAYRFWFLPDLARQLVRHGGAKDYDVAEVMKDPPAAVIADQNAIVWMSQRPNLTAFLSRHYVPAWRNLWVPGMNAVLGPGASFEWIVPRDGEYRPLASAGLVRHPWFDRPLLFASYFQEGGPREAISLPRSADDPRLSWRSESGPLKTGGPWRLKRGQRLTIDSAADAPLAVFAIPTRVNVLFRQPPPDVSIDAAAPRRTHVPRFGFAIE